MQSKLNLFSKNILETIWLFAILIVPIFMNGNTNVIFESEKAIILRSLALLSLLFMLVYSMEIKKRVSFGYFLKDPIILATFILFLVAVITTMLSILPYTSFWGNYHRRQGLYTFLSYIIIFFSIRIILDSKIQIDRIITVFILTTIPAGIYAIAQHLGLDIIPWGKSVEYRVSSFAGNSIFLSAYLIMVIPVTLMRVLETFKGAKSRRKFVSIFMYGALLIFQIITIIFTKSRGPFLGLMLGLFFFCLIYALSYRRYKLIFTIIGITVFISLFLLVYNLPESPMPKLFPLPKTLQRILSFDFYSRTVRTRYYIWEGSVELISDTPIRFLFGYGLENVEFAFSPFYPAELGKMESLRAGVDRAHNESLDALIQMGALGFLAKLALWGVLIFYPLKQLGLIKSRKYFGLSIMGGGVLGVFIPIVFDITPVLSGVTIPLGFLGGLAGYLIVANFKSTSQKLHSHFPIITAIVSALISHFVEIHFGIGTVNTYLYFWVMAAILSVILFKRKSLTKEVTTQHLSIFSILIGVMIAVLIFDFSLLSFKAGAKLWVIPVIIGISWVLAQIFIYLVRPEKLTFLNLSGQMLLSLVIAGFFYLSSNFWFKIFVSAQSWNSQNAMVNTTRLSYVVIWFLGFIFVMLIIAAVALYKKTPNKEDVLFSNRLSPLFLLIGFVLISFLIFLNLNSSRADTYLKYGQSCDRKGFLDCAAALFRKAVNLKPKREIFLTNLGSQYLKLAQNATSNSERKDYLKKSESTLKKAYTLNPYDTDHLRNLAVLYRQMIPTESSPEKRIALYQLSDELYGKAVQNFPQNVELINEWAALKLIARESQASRALAKQAIEIDSTYTKSYIRLADTYLMEDRYGDAVAAYNQSRKFRDPDSLDNYIKDIRKMLDRTRIINPLDSDKLRNFASLLRVRSRIAKREETKQEYIRLAEDCYRWASEMEPHNISIRKEWAALKLNNGNPAEARNIINDAIAITPELPDGYLWLAETYSAKSNYNQAIEAYQKALTLDENNLDAWSGIALAYVNLGQLQKALNANREALKIDPNDLITLRNISVLRYQTGDKSGAIDAAKRSLQIAPDDFITLSNAAAIFYHTGEMQQALDAAQKAFELAPNEGEKERLKGLIQQINSD